jgi:hypothetical protein
MSLTGLLAVALLVATDTSSTQEANPSAGLPLLLNEKQKQGVNKKFETLIQTV